MPNYRAALIETAVALNAAMAAFDIRQEVERMAKWEIEVLYGVFSLHNHQVSMPNNPGTPPSDENVRLTYAPANPRDFRSLAVQIAELLQENYRRGREESARLISEIGSPPDGVSVVERSSTGDGT